MPRIISSSETTVSLDLLGPNQHTNAEESRKSPALSILEARDGLDEIKGWPEQPRKLRDRSVLSVLLSISDVLIALVPVAFIGRTILFMQSQTILIANSTRCSCR